MIRQGDVLIEKCHAQKGEWKRVKNPILAEGEATGHAHVMECRDEIEELIDTAKDGTRFFRVPSAATVTHQEHNAVTLEPGTYRVSRQREWTDADEPRQVAD